MPGSKVGTARYARQYEAEGTRERHPFQPIEHRVVTEVEPCERVDRQLHHATGDQSARKAAILTVPGPSK
eukprot:3616661-Prymnesium_polylepis.2